MTPDRRALLIGAAAAALPWPALSQPERQIPRQIPHRPSRPTGASELLLDGRFVQGGFAMGRTEPGAVISVDGEAMTRASRAGLFVVGFDRDAAPSTTIGAAWVGGANAGGVATEGSQRRLDIAAGTFPSSRIDGLPPQTVTPSDPALLARIRAEAALKAEGFASRADTDDFRDGFAWPLDDYRISSLWGAQRVLNGTPARPHYGIDLAAPVGSVIRAPAAGLVCFARTGMVFEGGLTLIDHGQGLISDYLHQSSVDVVVGQRVERGQPIGRVGMEGRATGPHLCWRLKWRDRNLDPSLMVGSCAPGAA